MSASPQLNTPARITFHPPERPHGREREILAAPVKNYSKIPDDPRSKGRWTKFRLPRLYLLPDLLKTVGTNHCWTKNKASESTDWKSETKQPVGNSPVAAARKNGHLAMPHPRRLCSSSLFACPVSHCCRPRWIICGADGPALIRKAGPSRLRSCRGWSDRLAGGRRTRPADRDCSRFLFFRNLADEINAEKAIVQRGAIHDDMVRQFETTLE